MAGFSGQYNSRAYKRNQAAKTLQSKYRAKKKGLSSAPKRASAISKNRLSIKRLKKRELGGVFQRNFQLARMAAQYTFSKEKPLAFALNDFTSAVATNTVGGQLFAPVYVVDPNNPAIYSTSAVIVGNWETANPAAKEFTYDLTPKFQQWSDQNNATVSPTQYMPLSANYNLNFIRTAQVSSQPKVTIRIDVITTRRSYLPSKFHDYTMPECLGAFQDMAVSNTDGIRNAYNPALWSVRTRYVTLPAVDVGVNVIRQDQHKLVRLFERFKPRNIKLHLDVVNATQMEPFHLAVDPDIVRWCVISVGSNPVSGGNTGILIKLQRTIRYRDLDNKPL